ncbi:MAG: GNAT family N-acetyltransferase [Solirubrobacteraceae bacterium]
MNDPAQVLTTVVSRADATTRPQPDVLVSGPSLTLRYPEPADAPALYALARDPAVTRFLSWGPYRDVGEAEAWLATLPKRRTTGVALELAAVGNTGDPIGITLLYELNRRDRRAVVGTWLGRAHWGTGENREAKALVAHLAYGPLGLERLAAYADVRNGRSRSALERAEFKPEGVLRQFHRHSDVPRDVAVYSLLRAEWLGGDLARIPALISGADRLPEAFRVPRAALGSEAS